MALGAAACGPSGGSGGRRGARVGRAGAALADAARSGAGALSPAAEVGRLLFFDKSLSATGAMSCATCHDPDHAYGPPNDLAVQLGGADGRTEGPRAVPSLRYKEYTPAYADLLDNPDGISAPGPGGGFAWDGRANTLAQQARLPLLSPAEMANPSPDGGGPQDRGGAVRGPVPGRVPGRGLGPTRRAAFEAALTALEAFQREESSFHPYTSKFDLRAGNKIGGDFTAAETRGYKVFVDAKRGNCASCHYHGAGLGGSSGMFTDYSYEAIGVPRNRTLAANQDPQHFDLGLCGPPRADHLPGAGTNAFCGMFKTPTLRNVVTRKVFFHNGVIHSLEQAVRFYATRDTRPELWYPTVGGRAKAHPDRIVPELRPRHDPVHRGNRPEVRRPARRASREHRRPDAARRPRARRETAAGRARRAGPDLLPRDAHRWVPPARDPADRRALRELR